MADAQLPPGWTLQQIRDVSGDQEAAVLEANRAVKWVALDGGADEVLHPEIILGFRGLALVRAVQDDDWYMGDLHGDGSIACWAIYDDLNNALRGL
ncbi:hypothetical protein [Streptomyces sp. NPDC026673]|uniref:hypothetical protein n=1 Tax=Streptomyces sp. NPDC026673 TaxID=3155724 RepID=UPI0033E05B79